MQEGMRHISYLASLFLVLSILTPSITKLAHAVYEHEYRDCDKNGNLHVHEAELNCDFFKFHFSPQSPTLFFQELPLRVKSGTQNILSSYTFLSKFQKVHFVLRGPPTLHIYQDLNSFS